MFTSAALGAAVATVSPSWTGTPNKSSATLYSGGVPDGSDSVFQPDSVHEALIGLADTDTAQTGC